MSESNSKSLRWCTYRLSDRNLGRLIRRAGRTPAGWIDAWRELGVELGFDFTTVCEDEEHAGNPAYFKAYGTGFATNSLVKRGAEIISEEPTVRVGKPLVVSMVAREDQP